MKKKYKDCYGEYLGTCKETIINKEIITNLKNNPIKNTINGKFPVPHSHKLMFTYMMFDGNYYKIGQSLDVKKRFLNMRVGNPKLKIICYGRGRTEQNLHNEYENKNIRGEWFDLSHNDVLTIINKITGKLLTKESAIEQSFLNLNENNSKCYLHFGKYKGYDVYNMDTEDEIKYLKWLLEQDWLSNYYQRSITKHIESKITINITNL